MSQVFQEHSYDKGKKQGNQNYKSFIFFAATPSLLGRRGLLQIPSPPPSKFFHGKNVWIYNVARLVLPLHYFLWNCYSYTLGQIQDLVRGVSEKTSSNII